ncbi:MAG: hypothetical protein ACTHJ8_03525 [Mucilaginibacter sp.]
MIDIIEIDDLVRDFYRNISFRSATLPDLSSVKTLFFGDGILINNSFKTPISFSAESFVSALESQIAEGNLTQFFQHEIHSQTEVFSKLAHRISVYEYNFGGPTSGKLPRGVNYIQCIKAEGVWRILSMAWCDENEEHLIPQEYLR